MPKTIENGFPTAQCATCKTQRPLDETERIPTREHLRRCKDWKACLARAPKPHAATAGQPQFERGTAVMVDGGRDFTFTGIITAVGTGVVMWERPGSPAPVRTGTVATVNVTSKDGPVKKGVTIAVPVAVLRLYAAVA